MTIKELIEELNKFPPDTPVFVSDSEWGTDELSEIRLEEDRHQWVGGKLIKTTILVVR